MQIRLRVLFFNNDNVLHVTLFKKLLLQNVAVEDSVPLLSPATSNAIMNMPTHIVFNFTKFISILVSIIRIIAKAEKASD